MIGLLGIKTYVKREDDLGLGLLRLREYAIYQHLNHHPTTNITYTMSQSSRARRCLLPNTLQKMDRHGKHLTAEYNAHNQTWQMAGGKGAHPVPSLQVGLGGQARPRAAPRPRVTEVRFKKWDCYFKERQRLSEKNIFLKPPNYFSLL